MTSFASRPEALLEIQRRYFFQGHTLPYDFRRDALLRLREALEKHEDEVHRALRADLGKPVTESFISETGFVKEELDYTLSRLRRWMRPRKGVMSLAHFFSTYRVERIPRGNVLVFAPWNYPFHLLMAPLIGAIAAGNTVVLKPSEHAPATAKAIEELISEIYPPEHVAVITGEADVSRRLAALPFDFIFFTGSPATGKEVMKAAAENLTPVLLELGGKSPAVVDPSARIELAARRIAWGKWMNAGQTCIAPDYVLVHESVKEALVEALDRAFRSFEGPDSYARIVSARHFDRLESYLNGVRILRGGRRDRQTLYFEPTVTDTPPPDHPLMREEIFGPLLPVITYRTAEERDAVIDRNPYPLALYYFGEDIKEARRLFRRHRSGTGAVNDTLIQIASPRLPFGGIRTSGTGHYHGRHTFEAFTHPRTVAHKTTLFDIPLRYPPYSKTKLNLIRKFFG
ncbi:MAG: aldehyde dehydrogenase family protein [Chlorobi bacterium]|nr:aldehyde dehydrogenase family protein [Chlorobiota bacterium]